MSPRRSTLRVLALVTAFYGGAVRLAALPHPEEPIDPSKRAPISTQGAIQPAATMPTGTGVVGNRRILPGRASVPGVAIAGQRAPIVVAETRAKPVRKTAVRSLPAPRASRVSSASSLPAAIPRLDAQRYRKILSRYRDGQVQATEFTQKHLRSAGKTAALAEINRYVDPRATLEQQGIPVVTAGSAPVEPNSSTPVPVSRDNTAAGQ